MRAKSHDQRRGQWIINKIRFNCEFQKECERISKQDNILYSIQEKYMVGVILWDMENDKFDGIMREYDD